MKKQNFPQQTHFIGVLTPEDITLTLEDCRRYMNEAYGCRSGHLTPIHVSLIPPFRLPEEYSTEDLAKAIEQYVVPARLGFSAKINNFDAFGDRTLFAKVEKDDKWTILRDAVYSAVIKTVPGCIKKDQRPFTPHLKKSGSLTFILSSFPSIIFLHHTTINNQNNHKGNRLRNTNSNCLELVDF